MIKYPKGSEWRRWDLHVHTPGTQKNDCYQGETLESKWDNFYQAINTYIGDGSDSQKNIAVIGITDYLSVDNYFKVKEDNRLPASVKMILPNVELRIMPISKKEPVNIHCLFSPDLTKANLLSQFFCKLDFSYGGSNFNATRDGIIRLGKAIKNNEALDDESAYKIGIEQFVLNIETLEKVFSEDSNLKDNTIIVVANSNNDGASGITNHRSYFTNGESQLNVTRQRVYQLADLIFSSNHSDREYFLGKGPDNVSEVKHKCGSIMGCIHGSDAHCIEKLFEPDKQRYCWIKADPTFNGLKQIIYEPETRIQISELCPEPKDPYQIIDKVLIGDEKVQDDPILFNDHLTCIIGGKSTGKSLLLHNMALAIDGPQVQAKAQTTVSNIEGRQLNNVEVYWRDGTVSTVGEGNKHKMVYIPQTYLNRLSDQTEELTEIDKIISEIILINKDAKHAFDEMQVRLKNQKVKVDKLIYDVVQFYGQLKEKREKQLDIGTQQGLDQALKELQEKNSQLTQSATLSEEQINQYSTALTMIRQHSAETETVEKEIRAIQKVDSVVSLIAFDASFSNTAQTLVTKAFDMVKREADKIWKDQQKCIIEQLTKTKYELQEDVKNQKTIIDAFAPQISQNDAIKKISEAIQAAKEKIDLYKNIQQDIDQIDKNFNSSLANLSNLIIGYYTIHKEYANSINANPNISMDELDFSVETPYRMEAFCGLIEDVFGTRFSKTCKDIIDLDTINSDWFTADNLKKLIYACLEGKLKMLKRRTTENGLREILIDWVNSTYKVKMDGDLIDGMSPGKKALVLLKMLINLAESKCPILIDQPEDDLDNRSIFKELIPFVKRKKIQRQIIIVTHNANVVLGGDAEEIIIANQQGEKTPNKKFKFEYRSGAIEENENIDTAYDVLSRYGIQQHICDILEGGKEAFDLRKNKYHI